MMGDRQLSPAYRVRAIVLLEVVMAWGILCLCGLPFTEQKLPALAAITGRDGGHIMALIPLPLLLLLAFTGYFGFEPRQSALNLRHVAQACFIYNAAGVILLQWVPLGRIDLLPYLLQFICQAAGLMLLRRLSDRRLKRCIFQNRRHLVLGRQVDRHLMGQLERHGIGKAAYAGSGSNDVAAEIQGADYVYLGDDLLQEEKNRLLSLCIRLGKRVALVPRLYEISLQNAETTQIGDVMICRVERYRLSHFQAAAKRRMDIVLSVGGLVLFSPIMLWLAISIRLEDGGSVFYRQPRVGRHGTPFQIIKFRSMAPDAEEITGAVMSADGDKRVTRTGKIMRARRLDEIPQFINVLSGRMSLVGPRPERPEFVREFAERIPEYDYRLAVKPGMTGLAQIMGTYDTTAENKLKFDLSYIRNYSFLLDAKILLRTPALLFSRKSGVHAKSPPAGHGHG